MSAGCTATSARVARYAIASPAMAPARRGRPPRVRSWRSSRTRPAPSAERTASSAWRADARASSRLATFAQATSSTKPTAPSRTRSGVRTSPSITSLSDRALNVSVSFVSRKRRLQLRADPPQVVVDLREGHAWLRAADHGEELASSACRRRGAERRRRTRAARRYPPRRAGARPARARRRSRPARRRS